MPVRSPRATPVAMMSRMASRYWCSSWRSAAGSAVSALGRMLRRSAGVEARRRYSRNWNSVPFSVRRGSKAASPKAASSSGGMLTSHAKSGALTRVRKMASAGPPGASASENASAPPMTKIARGSGEAPRAAATAAANDGATSTSAGRPSAARTADGSPRDSTMFRRPGSGRARAGSDAQVLRPMITAPPSVRALNRERSDGSAHGRVPPAPMPQLGVAATTTDTDSTGGTDAAAASALMAACRQVCKARAGV